jgi:hypothetical protein
MVSDFINQNASDGTDVDSGESNIKAFDFLEGVSAGEIRKDDARYGLEQAANKARVMTVLRDLDSITTPQEFEAVYPQAQALINDDALVEYQDDLIAALDEADAWVGEFEGVKAQQLDQAAANEVVSPQEKTSTKKPFKNKPLPAPMRLSSDGKYVLYSDGTPVMGLIDNKPVVLYAHTENHIRQQHEADIQNAFGLSPDKYVELVVKNHDLVFDGNTENSNKNRIGIAIDNGNRILHTVIVEEISTDIGSYFVVTGMPKQAKRLPNKKSVSEGRAEPSGLPSEEPLNYLPGDTTETVDTGVSQASTINETDTSIVAPGEGTSTLPSGLIYA